jgi:glycosyltransferase involved in cell wall biosynthesis
MSVVEARNPAAPEAQRDRSLERSLSIAFVAPRHPDGSDWPWLSQVGSMRKHRFTPVYIENTFHRLPKATGAYVQWQYLRAMQRIAKADLAFLFSTEIAVGLTHWPAHIVRQPKRVYVGFTQDGIWPQAKIARLSRALQRCDAVTVFSRDERDLYLKRYQLESKRVHVIPIHTDETSDYSQYNGPRPMEKPYVLSMGSPNRRFTSIARACHKLNIPLVIITRPNHTNDLLDELAQLGATIICDDNKLKALTYLKHARLAAMAFQTTQLPGAFTTLVHAMFLGTPCVVTDCLGMRDYIENGQNGFIAPHDDDDALRQAIERMWNEPGLAERCSDTAQARAQQLHSLQSAADRFEQLAITLSDE